MADQVALRRLQKDLQEVKENPLFNVVGEPLEHDLFEWHVNVRSCEEDASNPLHDVIFHLVLVFPPQFPRQGPEVYLCTPLPHPNVSAAQPRGGAQRWKVSLWDCIPGFKGWSSAYGVQSVLLQLQTFLLRDDLLYDQRNVTPERAAQLARAFSCRDCGHTQVHPLPRFPSEEERLSLQRNRRRVLVSQPKLSHARLSLQVSSVTRNVSKLAVSDWQVVQSKKAKHAKPAQNEEFGKREEAARPVRNVVENMGSFGVLTQEPLTTILCLLSSSELASLSQTCYGLKDACEDGYVWKTMMNRHYPVSTIGAATMEDWRHAFQLERGNIVGRLRCFHTKCTHEEEVLGFPVTFTINPRSHEVDYIAVHLDILSRSAYAEENVRRTSDNEKFELLLPLYITEEHFERGLPLLKETAVALCRKLARDNNGFHPDMVLDFMPKLLNTMVVLLCDKGVQASERAIDGYCMIHRLFLALCSKFNLWKQVEGPVVRFKASSDYRVKTHTPDLGRLLATLSICTSEETKWLNIVQPLTTELFDRSVIWICKNNPSLVPLFKAAHRHSNANPELVRGAWDGCLVARRLTLFHAAFLNLVARPPKVSLQKVVDGYDALYGMPSASLKKQLQSIIKRVVEMKCDWNFYFDRMGLVAPSDEYITRWLGRSWVRSLEKRYHTSYTDFSKIQSSGVSKILLKGQSYSAPPNLSTVKMHEMWRYSRATTDYLDASCLLYDSNGHYREVVDYAHQVSSDGAIIHSGDIIDHERQQGTHVIQIDVKKVSPRVKEMYFTMSGWMGVTLNQIKLPVVRLTDADKEVDLCEYSLEDKQLGSYRSVIMCRMYRADFTPSQWMVEALGQLGDGSADNYYPLKTSITSIIRQRQQALSRNL